MLIDKGLKTAIVPLGISRQIVFHNNQKSICSIVVTVRPRIIIVNRLNESIIIRRHKTDKAGMIEFKPQTRNPFEMYVGLKEQIKEISELV